MSRTPEVLLLDVMDTLVYDPFFHEMPKFFGMTLAELLEAKHPTAWLEFELGKIEHAEMLERFFADGRTFDHEGFMRMVEEQYRWLDGVEGLLARLRRRGVPMYLLSNYPNWSEIIEAKLGLSRYAAWDFVSWKTGVRKPDPDAYLRAAEQLGVGVERCLFVDDRQGNCDAARRVGMQAHRFVDAGTLATELERAKVL